uniref:Uncharacterized protein n=1 Tax=Romanomermis culicivorax TaxID=13658 RepID=A0A915L625_ROMCU
MSRESMAKLVTLFQQSGAQVAMMIVAVIVAVVIAVIMRDRLNIGMHQEISTNDTLTITVIMEDDAFDHMFSKSGLHGNDNWAVNGDNGSIGDFDLSADR